jgi:ligand-binding sensor domain-containing protein
MKSNFFFFSLPVLFFLLISKKSISQEMTIVKVSPPTESFEGNITAIQDKNGYIWISSSNGLYKFDGYRFKEYRHNPVNLNPPSENRLETLYTGSDGIIWIATWTNGLERLDPHTGIFTHFKHNPRDSNSINSDIVRAIIQDHEGILWIGTHHGLDRYEPMTGKFKHYINDPNDSTSLSSNIVRALYVDRQGTLWVGTGSPWHGEGLPDDGGLNRMDRNTGRFTRYMHNSEDPHSIINNKVRAIFEDSKGVFWVGTAKDGLHTMNRTTGAFQRHSFDPLHPEKLSRPQVDNSLSSLDNISFISEDNSGDIWIGTSHNGINRYDRKTEKVVHYGSKDFGKGFDDKGYLSFCKSRDGIIWIGSTEGTLYRINLFAQKIPHNDLLGGAQVIIEGQQNTLWIGTGDSGLIFKDRNTGILKKFIHDPHDPKTISDNSISSVYQDPKGVIWAGTPDGGLNRFDQRTNSFISYQNNPNDANTISAGIILAIIGKGEDSLIIGTNSGIDFINTTNSSVTHFSNNPLDITSLSGG